MTNIRPIALMICVGCSAAANAQSLRKVWSADLGSVTYSQPAIHDGRVFIGTNNERGYLPEFPSNVDLGVLLCFDSSNGQFAWQASHLKLDAGRRHDWPTMGITSSPTAVDEFVYYVSNRAEVVCLRADVDVRQNEPVWQFDMIAELGVSPHNGSCSQPAVHGDLVFVVTGNGVGPSHTVAELNADAPSFIAINRTSGELVWSDASPGGNVLHGQWSSPIVITTGEHTQAVFPGGDGWLYAFDVDAISAGKGNPLAWKFDANPKTSRWRLGGRGTRNNIIAPPVFHDGLVYVALGQDPEHGDGVGGIVCIDPTGQGDVSEQQVFNKADPTTPIPHRRIQACDPAQGDFVRQNPNSRLVWRTDRFAEAEPTAPEYEQHLNRSIGRPAISENLLLLADMSGFLHCLDRNTGRRYWSGDLLSAVWSEPIVIGETVYVATEDGDLRSVVASADRTTAMPTGDPAYAFEFDSSVEANMTYHDGRLYVADRRSLHAFEVRQP